MKASYYLRKNEVPLNEALQIAPSDTSHEHQQRVEEWTQKSTTAPPSNRKRTVKEQENMDLDAKSQLIAEAVQLLDTREKQTRSRPATVGNDVHIYDNESDEGQTDGSQYFSIGKQFRNSKLSARNYVKLFESKMKRKKAYKEAISNTYPSLKSKKNLTSSTNDPNQIGSHVEPVSFRYRAARSVKFAVKPGSQQTLGKFSEDGSEDGDKWTMKQDNDRDWWRWKLKQRFLQNDELLHKLAYQRQKLETTITQGEKQRLNRTSIFSNKKPPVPDLATAIPSFPTARNSSWHVSVEIPTHMAQTTGSNKVTSSGRTSEQKAREPIPNFYTPSKQLISTITVPNPRDSSANPEIVAQQKLKILKKDPYLSKLLAGNEMFRPESMLNDNKQNKKHQLQHEYKNIDGNNPRRKLSLESLTDTEDELTATKFFNPDVKVLYERLSEMELLNSGNLADKSRFLAGGVHSREPSDGFLNLSILLETGRFNRYNKLPSVKLFANNKETTSSKQQAKKSEKSYNIQSAINKMKNSANLTNIKLVKSPLVSGATAPTNISEGNPSAAGQSGKIEDLPTNEWAKKLMSKVKKQDNSTKMDDDRVDQETFSKKSDQLNDIFSVQQRKYKVPIDQETNLLYHEILMSKWKKDKHGKEKDNDAGAKTKHYANTKIKRGEHGHDKKSMGDEKPRGLDIWLENIRERAKRDRVISPLPNNGEFSKGMPPLSEFEKSTLKMVEINK